jgi:hypothetical protein
MFFHFIYVAPRGCLTCTYFYAFIGQTPDDASTSALSLTPKTVGKKDVGSAAAKFDKLKNVQVKKRSSAEVAIEQLVKEVQHSPSGAPEAGGKVKRSQPQKIAPKFVIPKKPGTPSLSASGYKSRPSEKTSPLTSGRSFD